jgi:hypothetical protein
MQVFMSGHVIKDWKANSWIAARPQIAKRRSAGPLSGAGGFARRITPYHRSRRPHRRRCGASDRRHAVPGRRDQGRR